MATRARGTTQATPLLTALSFVNCTKQPPSLLFVLMTLGPAIAALAVIDRVGIRGPVGRALVTLGRVPLFYYLLQWYVIHGLAVLAGLVRGLPVAWMFSAAALGTASRGLVAESPGHLRRLGRGARRPLHPVPLVRRGQGAPSRRLAVLPLIGRQDPAPALLPRAPARELDTVTSLSDVYRTSSKCTKPLQHDGSAEPEFREARPEPGRERFPPPGV